MAVLIEQNGTSPHSTSPLVTTLSTYKHCKAMSSSVNREDMALLFEAVCQQTYNGFLDIYLRRFRLLLKGAW